MRAKRQCREAAAQKMPKVSRSTFSLEEKKQIILGFQKYGTDADALEQIQQEFLPLRTVNEVGDFVGVMRMRSKVTKFPDDVKVRAPIEQWLMMAEDLSESWCDFSSSLAKAVSVLGSLEPHDSKESSKDPDWTEIYLYVSALLQGEQPPTLSPIDSAVVLDLLQGLADQLRDLDTSQQCELMIRKHRLLNVNEGHLDLTCHRSSHDIMRKALEEDPLEQPEEGSTSQQSPDGAAEEEMEDSAMASTSTADQSSKRRYKPLGRRKGQRTHKQPTDKQHASLYSINPFCIPIKYLKPGPRTRSQTK